MEAAEADVGLLGLLPLLGISFGDFALEEILSVAFWAALWKIIVANIVLSGDNAVVIALASHNLSEKYRRRAIVFGSAGAVVLRIIFCAVIGLLLGIPYLKLAGGALLLWIGAKLAAGEEGGEDVTAHENVWAAIWTIVVADAVMSLDNAIAIAAAAKGDLPLIAIGLALSIPIIVFGATLIAKLLDRFPWLGMVGAGLIGWIAGEVMAGDETIASALERLVPHAETVCAAAGAVLVLALGFVVSRLQARKHAER
ncbi:MAG: TerC family protein [Alphaproteobacteria bacterium]|nr:TerC family protein [Alphaproteobacteria bacterium]